MFDYCKCWLGWVLFAGSVIGFLSPFSSIVVRSILSKSVSKAELGKIFSLPASLEAAGRSLEMFKIVLIISSHLVPLFSAPLLTEVYTQTIAIFPGKKQDINVSQCS